MAVKQKVPVSERAVIQRINRKVHGDDLMVKKTRGVYAEIELGCWYVLNFNGNYIVHKDIGLETYAREVGALAEHEQVRFDE